MMNLWRNQAYDTSVAPTPHDTAAEKRRAAAEEVVP